MNSSVVTSFEEATVAARVLKQFILCIRLTDIRYLTINFY